MFDFIPLREKKTENTPREPPLALILLNDLHQTSSAKKRN